MLLRSTRTSFTFDRLFCSSSLSKNTIKPRPLDAYLAEELIGLRDFSKVPNVFEKWKEEGHSVVHDDIVLAVRELKSNRRQPHALMIWDFVAEQKIIELNQLDYACHLSLIARYRGLNSAEIYFESIPEKIKDKIIYSALLRIYINNGKIAKAEALMKKMAEGGFLTTAQPYIHMMFCYMKHKRKDNARKMLKEMKKCIKPNSHSYNKLLNICADRKNVKAAKMVFSAMKEAKVVPDWLTHGALARLYIKNKMFQKAASALKEMEDLLFAGNLRRDCNSLIQMHGDIGNRDEILRIWDKMKLMFGETSIGEYKAIIYNLFKKIGKNASVKL